MLEISNILVLFSIVLESFPISSSAHVYLLIKLYSHFFFISPTQVHILEWCTHGCYVIVLGLFFRLRWKYYLLRLSKSFPLLIKIMIQGFIVEIITVILYLFLRTVTITIPIVALGFLVTSVLLYSLRFISTRMRKHWTMKNSIFLGFAQGLAIIPGISRFASTFVCARWLGIRSDRAFELSFLLGVPLNLAACVGGFYHIVIHKQTHILNLSLGLSMLIASIGMYMGLCIVQKLIQKNWLWICSLYTCILAIGIMIIYVV